MCVCLCPYTYYCSFVPRQPRAINFLHSEAEGYTELVLDLFEAEGDQVILVFTYLPDSSRIRIGQVNEYFTLGTMRGDIWVTIKLFSRGVEIT